MLKTLLSLFPIGASLLTANGAITLTDIAARLDSIPPVTGHATYSVYLPSSPDPVVHDINILSIPTDSDSLSRANYLLDWTLETPSGKSRAFTAYHNGNYYRYHNNRLAEYHLPEDEPSMTSDNPVHLSGQFIELIPRILARRLQDMATDSTYKYKITSNDNSFSINGVHRLHGYDGMEYDYTFDTNTWLPTAIDIVYNPTSIAEQTISAHITWDTSVSVPSISEDMLMTRFPDIFARYRTSNFRVNNLIGQPVPTFTAVTPTRERYHHVHNENFRAPTILAFLDTDAGDPRATVRDIRAAVGSLALTADVLYIFDSDDSDAVEDIVGPILPGETILFRATSTRRDLGVTDSPTLIFCSPKAGRISDIQIGYNKNMPSIVTQKTTSANFR